MVGLELLGEPAGAFGFAELADQVVQGGVVDREAGLAGGDGQRDHRCFYDRQALTFGLGFEEPKDLAGDGSLEAAPDVAWRLALRGALGGVVAGAAVVRQPGQGDGV